jgi:hypothetical protein
MDGGLRFTETLKERFRPSPPRRRQRRLVDERCDLGEAAMRMGMRRGAVCVSGTVRMRRLRVLIVLVLVIVVMGIVVMGIVVMGIVVMGIVMVMIVWVMVIVMIVVRLADAELGGADTGAEHASGSDLHISQGEAAERLFQLVERQAGIEERTEDHVAGNARRAIEVQHSRH